MKYEIRMFGMNDHTQIQIEVNKMLSDGWILDEYYPKMMNEMIMFKFSKV